MSSDKEKELNFSQSRRILHHLVKKDILVEFRQKTDLIAIILFDVISIFIFSAAYNAGTNASSMPIPIYVIQLWLILFFTMLFVISKLFIKEKESGTLPGILMGPIPVSLILVAKIIYGIMILVGVQIILVVISFFFSSPQISITPWAFLLFISCGLILPTIDLAICGTLISALSIYIKHRSFILPLLFFPLVLPLVFPIIQMNIALLMGNSIQSWGLDLLFILGHMILMFSIMALIGKHLLQE